MAYTPQYNPWGYSYPINPHNVAYNATQGQTTQGQNTPIQSGELISVPSEEVARNWPVAHGNSVSFKNEHAPFIYTKTLGFGQMEQPVFEKFRVVKEDDVQESEQEATESPQMRFASVEDIESLRMTMKHFKSDLDVLRKKMDKLTGKREEGENDD